MKDTKTMRTRNRRGPFFTPAERRNARRILETWKRGQMSRFYTVQRAG